MTPQREKYLVKCSEREWCCRRRLFELKNKLKTLKNLATAPDNKYWLERIKQIKYELSAYRHELARLKRGKGVVPVWYDDYEEISYAIVGTCPECGTYLFGDGTNNYCHYCGRRVLWEKMKL